VRTPSLKRSTLLRSISAAAVMAASSGRRDNERSFVRV
jgi:hypothetical protein